MYNRREFLQATAIGLAAMSQPVLLTSVFQSSVLANLSPINISFLKALGQAYKIRNFSEMPGFGAETEETFYIELHDYYTRSFQRLKTYHEQMQVFKDHPREAKIFIQDILPACREESWGLEEIFLEQFGFCKGDGLFADTIWYFRHNLDLPFMFSNVDDDGAINFEDTEPDLVEKITKSIHSYFKYQLHGCYDDDDEDKDFILFMHKMQNQAAQWLPGLIKQFFPHVWREILQGQHPEIRKTLKDLSVEIKDGPLRNEYYDQHCAYAWTQIHKGNDYY